MWPLNLVDIHFDNINSRHAQTHRESILFYDNALALSFFLSYKKKIIKRKDYFIQKGRSSLKDMYRKERTTCIITTTSILKEEKRRNSISQLELYKLYNYLSLLSVGKSIKGCKAEVRSWLK